MQGRGMMRALLIFFKPMDIPRDIEPSTSSVLVAMSGGVDSSVAAALLQKQGFAVSGIYMITHDDFEQDLSDARRVAAALGIELEAVDLRSTFAETVIRYFVEEYKNARTPNPCVYCNRHIKFGKLIELARQRGADAFATGHYIRLRHTDSGSEVLTAKNTAKDQSYILCMVEPENLQRVIFPVGQFTKDRVRDMARELKLPIHDKADSQEICFVPDDDYPAMLEKLCPELKKEGLIVDTDGAALGRHEGIYKYTIGQRRGLGIALGEPAYVVRLEPHSNKVVLGSKEDLMQKVATVRDFNWLLVPPAEEFRAFVKIRYNHRGQWADIIVEDKDVLVRFEQPASAVTPGQACAVYLPEENAFKLLGGGWL
ncbi:tRNA-specific 2-thiouridylase MnmA [Limihaloglobus sulfuriphilus]|uniref:tRNA-specific 2-thiouridylase MnmA n=1 Tax=Limihaloglobus sulfuriphilus TaxID=1851148 RepID=A0A1Q2MD92_9BACT|nr:tRNA 2-thiouridine(34) synthase MnmA [Limihaloglobus sulfuriphilus]AQQ70640.1 tRNA-specific 2-thiouridylase MnmA [Limihaloglobus sulfuriphilus]